jgi:hypothetical protein
MVQIELGRVLSADEQLRRKMALKLLSASSAVSGRISGLS